MKVLFLHGLESSPGGAKVEHLLDLGHTVFNPALPKNDFEESVRIAQEEVDTNRPDVIVGSSRGGAVAMAVDRAGARLVLIAPAWQRFGGTASVPPGTMVLHCTTDDQVPFSDSEKLQGASLIPCGEGHRMIDPNALESLGHAVEGTLKSESLLREYIEDILLEEAEVSALSRDVDDILDDAIRDAAPEIVRDIREREVDEDIDEFIDGALHGSWDTRELSYADVPNVGDNAEVRDEGDSIEVTEMYRLGYQWGWDNPGKIDSAENVPSGIRREMVEYALENFKSRVTEEFVINAMEQGTAYVKKQMGDVHDILKKAKEKFGWKVAPAIVSIEVVEHAVLPTVLGAIHPIFYGLAAIPTVEILVASALAIAKARMPSVAKVELPPGHLDWYESEYGKAMAESRLREYIKELIA